MSEASRLDQDPTPSPKRRLATAFLTLRGRLLLLIILATVPAILFIFVVSARERQSALARMETEARHLGSLAAREHAHELAGAASLLRRLSIPLACGGDAPVGQDICPAYLPVLLSGFPQFANIGVASAQGEVICSAAPIEEGADLSANAAFERAVKSSDVETGTYVVGFIGRPVVHLAQALRSTADAVCGVAFVAVELGWLDQLAMQANLPADYSLLITDRSGHVLARSGADARSLVAEQGRANPELAEALIRPHGAVLNIGAPPTPRYFVATPMAEMSGIFVIAGLPYERVQATANAAFYRTLAWLFVVTMLAIASAMVAAELSVLRVLRALTRAVRAFGGGNLAARPPLPGSHGELRELAISFGSMADALAARQHEALDAQERLRALSHRLQTVRDEEAGRIARELHDELGQVLTGLKMELVRVRRICTGDAHNHAGEQALVEMSKQIDGAIDTVRRLSSELRPPVLDRLGLTAALDWLTSDFEDKSELAIFLQVSDVVEPVDRTVSTAIFRVVQEALTNVVRHAQATEVKVDLRESNGVLHLTVKDNGRGIDRASADGPRSLGIFGMRERVLLLAGAFRVQGEPGSGTTITVAVPRDPPGGQPAVRE